MVIITKKILNEFADIYSDAENALNHWMETVKEANWRNGGDVRQTFRDADFVGDNRWIFNIRGNRYRLVAMIFFSTRTAFIRSIGTHTEYDAIEDVSTI
jgi:mRNA interferase HigB